MQLIFLSALSLPLKQIKIPTHRKASKQILETMNRERQRGCCRQLKRDVFPRHLKNPRSFNANHFAPGQPKPEKQTYTSEQDFIQKRTQRYRQPRPAVFVRRIVDGRVVVQKLKERTKERTVTSDSWKIYQQNQIFYEELRRIADNLSDSEISSYAAAFGYKHPLLDEKRELQVLSSAPLDSLDVTDNTNTVTEPVVEGLPCDTLDIPAAGFCNSLLDAQVPENTAAPVEDLVVESLLGDKHNGGPKGELVVEGSSFDPHGEDESLGTVAKKKSHKTTHEKNKRKSIVLSPGRTSMKKMKMGPNFDDISQDNKVAALVKSVI